MRIYRSFIAITVLTAILSFGSAYALEPIPEESGFSGFLSIGAGYSYVKSNMISGNDFGNVGNRTVDSLTSSPDGNSSGGIQPGFDLRYTFGSTGTQLFVGTALEDVLRYDFATQLGVAQKLPGENLVAASFLFSSVPTQVWRDPYVLFAKREKTDRDSKGFRVAWDRIFGTQLQIQYSYRKIELDDEFSGVFLGLNPIAQGQLDREGKEHQVDILYRFIFGDGKHRIVPAIIYNNLDLDGGAMKNDGIDFQLTYGYNAEKYSFVINGVIGYRDYDDTNPIYLKTRDDDIYGAGLIAFYHTPFGWSVPGFKKTSLYFKTDYIKSDANINFYDTELFGAGAGLFLRF
jgi:hypothetical protein